MKGREWPSWGPAPFVVSSRLETSVVVLQRTETKLRGRSGRTYKSRVISMISFSRERIDQLLTRCSRRERSSCDDYYWLEHRERQIRTVIHSYAKPCLSTFQRTCCIRGSLIILTHTFPRASGFKLYLKGRENPANPNAGVGTVKGREYAERRPMKNKWRECEKKELSSLL